MDKIFDFLKRIASWRVFFILVFVFVLFSRLPLTHVINIWGTKLLIHCWWPSQFYYTRQNNLTNVFVAIGEKAQHYALSELTIDLFFSVCLRSVTGHIDRQVFGVNSAPNASCGFQLRR